MLELVQNHERGLIDSYNYPTEKRAWNLQPLNVTIFKRQVCVHTGRQKTFDVTTVTMGVACPLLHEPLS